MFLMGKWEPVDFIWSFSSIEHSGLGRYGDPLDPFGDLEAVAQMHCMLKPGGVLYLGIPVGPDAVHWNANRVYGKLRLHMILLGWEIIDAFGDYTELDNSPNTDNWRKQPVLLLRKPLSAEHVHHHHNHDKDSKKTAGVSSRYLKKN